MKSEPHMQKDELDILFHDKHYIAVNKPSGLLVHRTYLDSRETRFALQIVRNQIDQHVYPISRLDKPTSGILLFGLSPDIVRETKKLFDNNEVAKTYLAIVRGYITEEGTIDYPLRTIQDKFIPGQSDPDERKESRTSFKRLATVELPVHVDKYPTTRYSLVVLTPHTGRRHQLRRHMKHIAHPIAGDRRYGKTTHNNFFAEHYNCNRLLLAATGLQFTHPVTGQAIKILTKPGECFLRVIETFGWGEKVRLFLSGKT